MGKTTANFRESVKPLGSHRIDREAGIIYGVKIIGSESKNRRYYRPDALNKAKKLYEGMKVNINHVRTGGSSERPFDDFWGALQGVRVQEGKDGLYADLAFLKSHEKTEKILEAAEKFPDKFGLSHDAVGEKIMANGRVEIVEILKVNSVDLVGSPATTGGLFESVQEYTTVSEFSESLQDAKAAAALKEMISSDPLVGDLPLATLSDPAEQVKEAFRAALLAIVDNDTFDSNTKLSKIKVVLKAQDQASGAINSPDGVPPVDSGDGEGGDTGSKPSTENQNSEGGEGNPKPPAQPDANKPKTESSSGNVATDEDDEITWRGKESEGDMELQEQLAAEKERADKAETKLACSMLLQEHKRAVTDVRINALMSLSDAERIELIESFPPIQAESKQRPATSPSVLRESHNSELYPSSSEEFSRRLGRRS